MLKESSAHRDHRQGRRPAPVVPAPLEFAIDELRGAVRLFHWCRQSFLEQFSEGELLALYRAYKRSEFDIPPDRWTREEIKAALEGAGTGAEYER